MGKDYLVEIKREVTYIKPHEEDDLEWYDQGLELLEKKEYAKVEKKFNKILDHLKQDFQRGD
ncbi:MAG: hypothetical protein E3J87_04050 [Candidatus Cloacimonadota bacterium]|nr:MAG: hypothetical protein E3J87_04050 [Candidatus Cloacimonadota bacterium]